MRLKKLLILPAVVLLLAGCAGKPAETVPQTESTPGQSQIVIPDGDPDGMPIIRPEDASEPQNTESSTENPAETKPEETNPVASQPENPDSEDAPVLKPDEPEATETEVKPVEPESTEPTQAPTQEQTIPPKTPVELPEVPR